MKLAVTASERSEDPYIKVGCCCLRADHSIVALGYNGPPPGVTVDWSNRDERRKRMIHAEINALRYTKPGECSLLVCTLQPCLSCLTAIASWGIKQVIYGKEYIHNTDAMEIAKEFGITMTTMSIND